MKELTITATELTIEDNFDEIKKDLLENIQRYDIAVTEDNVKEAKVMATELNKLSNVINRAKIDKAKELVQPIEQFKDKAKQLIEVIQDSRTKLLSQVQVFEDKKLQDLRDLVAEYLEDSYTRFELPQEYRDIDPADSKFIKLSNLLESGNLTKKVKEDIDAEVEVRLATHNTRTSRRSNLTTTCQMAGLLTTIPESTIEPFIDLPEHEYNSKLNHVLQAELERQNQVQEYLTNQKPSEVVVVTEPVVTETPAPVSSGPTITKVYLVNAAIKWNTTPDTTAAEVRKRFVELVQANGGKVLEVDVIGEGRSDMVKNALTFTSSM